MTIVGPVKLIGTVVIAGRLVCGNDRFAPHLLQYFSSTVISLPQVGQYIDTSKQSTVLRSKEFEKIRIPFYEELLSCSGRWRIRFFRCDITINYDKPHDQEFVIDSYVNRL